MVLEGIELCKEVLRRGELKGGGARRNCLTFHLRRLSNFKSRILREFLFNPLLQLGNRQEQDVHGKDHLRGENLLLLEFLGEFELHFPSRKRFS